MRRYNLGGSWAVSAAGIARIIHAGCKDHGLHDDAPVRRTAQEEHAAVRADAQLSETQRRLVTGSMSQSMSLHHCSQEFVGEGLEKRSKTTNAGQFFS
jgi:hypothetical protein